FQLVANPRPGRTIGKQLLGLIQGAMSSLKLSLQALSSRHLRKEFREIGNIRCRPHPGKKVPETLLGVVRLVVVPECVEVGKPAAHRAPLLISSPDRYPE